jgi:L-iditol 2-dehydrogenase
MENDNLMRVARLHGIRDMRIDTMPIPAPGPGEILVKIEACGVCATDSRKYEIGVNDGDYPFNPGHEWLGRVAAVGSDVKGWTEGDRLYGDTYGGYGDYAVIPVEPIAWSRGPLRLPDDLPIERAIFIEPLADCLHAVHDQARLKSGHRAIVIAAGVMGLKIIAEAAQIGVDVLVVEPRPERRELARLFGARSAIAAEDWQAAARDWCADRKGADAIILTIGEASLVNDCIKACRPGGRVVLFAGFGNRHLGTINLNDLHYREVALVGSEWIGTPPNQRRERYDEALARLRDGGRPFEKLVTSRCSFADLEAAIVRRQNFEGIKTMFVPEHA